MRSGWTPPPLAAIRVAKLSSSTAVDDDDDGAHPAASPPENFWPSIGQGGGIWDPCLSVSVTWPPNVHIGDTRTAPLPPPGGLALPPQASGGTVGGIGPRRRPTPTRAGRPAAGPLAAALPAGAAAAAKVPLAAQEMAAMRAALATVSGAAAAWLAAPSQARFKVSRIEVGGEPVLWVTSTLIQGGYGKFRLGARAHEVGGEFLAVKESRLNSRRRLDGHKQRGKRGPLTCFTDPENLARELEAARVISVCCPPQEVYDVDGKVYVTSALMPCTLGSAIRRLGERAEVGERVRAAFYLFASGCELLAGFHHDGWVHGDIKPANLFLTAAGGIELGDCGISRRVGGDGRAHHMACTLAYAAPELFSSHGATGSADLWSLGVSCVEMVVPELQHGPDGPRRRAAFIPSLSQVGAAMPSFAQFLHDRVFEADPGGRASTQEACRQVAAWPESSALSARGRRALAAVAEPETPIVLGGAILAAQQRAGAAGQVF